MDVPFSTNKSRFICAQNHACAEIRRDQWRAPQTASVDLHQVPSLAGLFVEVGRSLCHSCMVLKECTQCNSEPTSWHRDLPETHL